MVKRWIAAFAAAALFMAPAAGLAAREISDSPLYDGLRFVREDGKCGYIDMDGNIVVPIEYDVLSAFSEGVAIIAKDGKYGYVDHDGNILVPLEYEETVEFSRGGDGLAPVKKDGRWGYMENPLQSRNPDGTPVIHWIDGADRLDIFRDGHALVIRANTFSVINRQFEEVFGGPYDSIEQTQYDNCFIVSQSGKKGVFRYDGTPILPLEYDDIYAVQMEPGVRRFRVQKDGKQGLYNLDGSVMLACVFDELRVSQTASDRVIASFGGYYGILTPAGEQVPCIYEEIWEEPDGYQVKLDGKYGLLGTDFSVTVPPVYEEMGSIYAQGIPRAVKRDGLYGYIDQTGREIIPPQYEEAFWFRGGLAVVRENGKYGCINTRGQFVIPAEYDAIEWPVSGEAYMEKGGVREPFVNPLNLDYNPPAAERYMVLQIGTYDMYTGEYISLDAAPTLIGDTTYLPMRALVEEMGGRTEWQPEQKTARFTRDGKTVTMQAGSGQAWIDGEAVPLAGPAEIINDRIYAPLRFVMEALGADVQWEDTTQKIVITY